ncbi:extracellular solute-binding protein [Cohnella fermenti]|uniref:Extracellular solute-binding protein n=1 Tax=Cohnella fermenti TaxID=2565925 RepID=A0A4S4BQ58_9BACL|nr:extracellular solute-binding protein [Cohnella fermenti]THF76890.1 extracellular solute-binding protein [Cohnella fermenti]
MSSNLYWKIKKPASAVALCMIAGALLAGCSGNGNNGNNGNSQASPAPEASSSGTPAGDPYADLPKKVSISTFDRGAVSSDEGTYEDNRWTKWIGEQSGIDVSIVPVPRNQAQDKLNVLIASNQAPDLIWEYDRTYIGKLVTQGAIQPVDDYIEKYSTSYKAYLQEHPELKPYLTFDGKMYAVATARTLDSIANHGIWIRQDWLDKLNLKTPTTMEELIEVAKAFKDGDPDGNGKADTTALVGSTTFDAYSAMNAAISNQWYLEDGQMKYGATLDRFGDAMAWEKTMYEEGLVDKEYLTDKNFQRAIQLWTTGKAGIFVGSWGGSAMENHIRDMLKNVPDANPVPLEPVSTSNGKYGLYQETSPFIFVAFNKEMGNPKAAVEYLDWLVDSGWKSLVYGTEGVHYKDVNGVAQVIDSEKYKKEVSYAGEYAVLRNDSFTPADLPAKAASDELSQRLAGLSEKGLETATKNKFRRDIPYQPSFTEVNEIQTAMKPFIEEIRARVTTQGASYTADWGLEEIRKEWQRLGGEAVEAKAQEWYEANKASFE